ncbi:plasma kallikrein [Anomaloglossus baeobatrachus]|uniref:plasma kallikrein n=1 Tax=Anomaloglossus baeobatrachus TaxID=238106 RepID=UPI003F4F92F4
MTFYYTVASLFLLFDFSCGDCVPELQHDVLLQGGDLSTVFTPDAEYCQMVCTFSPRCLMFSYLPASWPNDNERFACILKASPTLTLQKVVMLGTISGHSLKHCTKRIYACRDKIFSGLDMIGTNYNISRVTSVEECRERCTNNEHCQFFTYVTEKFHSVQLRNMCYFKYSGKGLPTKIRQLPNVMTGFSLKACGMSSLDCQRDIFQEIEFSGESLTSVFAPNVHMCQKICTFYPNCLYFTYVTKDSSEVNQRNRCYLKTSKSLPPTNILQRDNVFSGFSLLSCKSAFSVCPLPVLDDAVFLGTDLHVEDVNGHKDCQQLCTNNIECQYFTYSPDHCNRKKCKCQLRMSSNGLPTGIEHGKGGISGFSLRLCKSRTVGGCGKPVEQASRIVGGSDSILGEWPWQVSMHLKLALNRHVCGGSIISHQWIATAAHCVAQWPLPRFWSIYAGFLNQSEIKPTTPVLDIEQIIIHPEYTGAEGGNDIALLKLRTPMAYNEYQQAICLPPIQDSFVLPSKCWITGWGYINETGTTSDVLQKAEVPPQSSTECQKSYSTQTIGNKVLCAGYKHGQIDSCKGDSGGPLNCLVDKTWYLVGITSWGEGCARPDKPGVYTKVTEFIDWIVQHTQM